MYFVNYANTQLVPVVNAKTLAAAKRAATRNCIFQAQTVNVFEGETEDSAVLVAYRNADPINANSKGKWVEVAG